MAKFETRKEEGKRGRALSRPLYLALSKLYNPSQVVSYDEHDNALAMHFISVLVRQS